MSAIHHATPASGVALLEEKELPGRLEGLRQRALRTGTIGLGVSLLLALVMPRQFFPAYLASFCFFIGIGVGSLAALLLHHVVGGEWGFVIRRPLEAATTTLPWMALLFLPLAFSHFWGYPLYPWADPAVVNESHTIGLKAGYLNIPFWLARAALYLGIWCGLAVLFRRGSLAQDLTDDPAPTRRNQTFAPPGLVLIFVSVTFATIDWIMSIEPEWYSTIFGVLVLVSWSLTALCTAVLAASHLKQYRTLAGVAGPVGFNDLGNLMLAFTMLWAYMSFSQYLIIWSGNLAEEVPWYLKRSVGGWRGVAACLMLFHFFVPFFCLLVRENKRRAERLWRIAFAILVMHFINVTWWILPAFPGYQWLKVLAVVPAFAGIGGLWLTIYAGSLASRPLVPLHDPLLAEAFEHAHSHHGEGHSK